MKAGQSIYYFNQDGASVPAKIVRVNYRTNRMTINGDFHEPPFTRTVKADNCQLQSEWAKENLV